ncbi:MAG: BCCT family transporter [Leptospiraceae bacterium]|nr:BCCT family transporter [Leptospiraceae bacterium]MCP5500665.1 BCCT family transporter [Leptospiraceae bacterium]
MKDDSGVDKYVFSVSVFLIGIFVLFGLFLPEDLEKWAGLALNFSIDKFGWFYLISTFIMLIFCIYLIFGPYAEIRLGKDEDRPAYSYFTWLAMLFSAGMGIGLVFYGVAEPMIHYARPPMGMADPYTNDAARLAFRYSFFHWGLHPWAIYSTIALAIAFFQFRKNEPGLISVTLRPLMGDNVDKVSGKWIDIISIIATAFGVATSLGLGSLQIHAGLHYLFGLPEGKSITIFIIIITTVLFLISAMTGLDKGIKILSNTNLTIAALLFLFIFFVGPTNFIIELFTTTVGSYIQNFIPMSFRMNPFTGGKWLAGNTLFYWAWWIAWAPFVGTFIARVSRGRTIREFVVGVMLAPTLLGCLWFSALGGSSLFYEMFHNAGIVKAVLQNETTAIFLSLAQLPLGSFLGFIATSLIIVFFVTSADSATFVLGMLSSKGDMNPKNSVKFTWGVLQASIAITLLLTGGLKALKTAAIVIALPFSFILLAIVFSLLKILKEDLASRKNRT